jgi:hypothetical protein
MAGANQYILYNLAIIVSVKVVASDYVKYEGWGNYIYQVGERSCDGSKTLPKVRLTSEYWRPCFMKKIVPRTEACV